MQQPARLLQSPPDQWVQRFYRLKTRYDVADLLEVDEERLVFHLVSVPAHKRYQTFEIKKRAGGMRTISAPATALKILQSKLAHILHAVYYERRKPSVHSFIRGRSIVSNADAHARRRFVFNLDLHDFFPTITFRRLKGLWMGKTYNLPEEVATVLAQICCLPPALDPQAALPQGAPTSPIVSNMICAKMDSDLQKLAQKHRCFYTRYADDMTFSTNIMHFPPAVALTTASGNVEVGPELLQIITSNGFQVNTAKVRLRTHRMRQEVTGLTVNRFSNLERSYIRQVRAMLHAWQKYGLDQAQAVHRQQYDHKHRFPDKAPPPFSQIVKGKIEYLGMVRGKDDPIYQRYRRQLHDLAPDLVKNPPLPPAPVLAPALGATSVSVTASDVFQLPISTADEMNRIVRLTLQKHFDIKDIIILIADLNIDKDEIAGEVKSEKVASLVQYCRLKSRFEELVELINERLKEVKGVDPQIKDLVSRVKNRPLHSL